MKKAFLLITLLFFAFLFSAKDVKAVCTSSTSSTVNVDCSFTDTVDGVDAGTGTTNTGAIEITSAATLTIQSGQTIATGSVTLTDGVLFIISGGQLKPGTPLWVIDTDSDGYPDSTTQYAQDSAPSNGIRRNAAGSFTVADCYGTADVFPGQDAWFTVDRGDGSFDYNCDDATTKRRQICACSCADPTPCTASCSYVEDDLSFGACGANEDAGPASCTRNDDEYGACVSCTTATTTYDDVSCH